MPSEMRVFAHQGWIVENESYIQPSAWKRPLIMRLPTTRSTAIREMRFTLL
jgi:hypothetical protein